MRDKGVSNNFNPDKVIKCADGNTAEMKEKHFRPDYEKNKAQDESSWNSSVLRVLFKNESFARKYKVKVEKFLKELLDEGEEFVVCHPTYVNNEEDGGDSQSFHIDKDYNESTDDKKDSQKVPVYSTLYEDTLNCKEEIEEKIEEEKPNMMTCFNCLGDHHMKDCPEKLDRSRINANKKEILLSGSTIRYHTDDQNNGFKAGIISDNLRRALGLRNDQLPLFIYHMRVIGYPPGWMNEALFEKSGLSLFDTHGKAVDDNQISPSELGVMYDAAKFIDFPGFNTPVPQGFTDEWKNLNLPPLQAHQQLQEALRSPNIIDSKNSFKRKPKTQDDADTKKQKYAEQPRSPISNLNVSRNSITNPDEETFEFRTPDSKQKNKRHSMSISMSPGTPILEQGNPFQKLPDADKFAQGITEHLPFENLPDAVGTFEKMRGVISTVQKKLCDIKNS